MQTIYLAMRELCYSSAEKVQYMLFVVRLLHNVLSPLARLSKVLQTNSDNLHVSSRAVLQNLQVGVKLQRNDEKIKKDIQQHGKKFTDELTLRQDILRSRQSYLL
jgi:hypothetical protein